MDSVLPVGNGDGYGYGGGDGYGNGYGSGYGNGYGYGYTSPQLNTRRRG